MANSISSRTWRDKYRASTLDYTLRNAMVAEKIVAVDRSNNYRIQNPYLATPTTTVQALAGTYTLSDTTTTDDTLTVTDEFIVASHIFDFQQSLSNFDLFEAQTREMNYSVALKIDQWVVNNLCEDGTGTYTTPAGGFGNAANVIEIFSNLNSKFDGYADTYNGKFVVLENTDMVGIYGSGATAGFQSADAVLNNGKVGSLMGIDIYVVRTGTFTDATVGTTTWTNNNHRVAGVKNMATMAMPGGAKFEEKSVTLKTGKELVAFGYVGFKLWAQKTALIIDITLS